MRSAQQATRAERSVCQQHHNTATNFCETDNASMQANGDVKIIQKQ